MSSLNMLGRKPPPHITESDLEQHESDQSKQGDCRPQPFQKPVLLLDANMQVIRDPRSLTLVSPVPFSRQASI